MKARMRANGITSKAQKRAVRELIAEEHKKQAQGNVRRLFKLFCVSLYEEYGFAAKRGGRVINQVSQLADEKKTDPVFWAHVDRLLKQIGYGFPDENYDEVDD